ncbi:MAG: glycosyltransferase family 39 protein [Chloroflexi bacterium]|nr:glycosyltransferase family 39 protein [Chloroflexota bacterium]
MSTARATAQPSAAATTVRPAPAASGKVALLVVLGITVLAFVIRWPHLWTIPIWTDEGDEAIIAARLVRTGIIPLANDNLYNGPIFNYLAAVAFWLAGTHYWVPRLVAYVFGALTVIPTFLLASELVEAGPAARLDEAMRHRAVLAGGLAAGLLLGLNAAHIVVNSHIGWGHCLTPFFTTAGVWLVQRAVRLGRDAAISRRMAGTSGGVALVLAGFCLSLGFQSHPTVAVLLPAVVVFMLWKHRGWLASPWPYLAGVAFVIGQAPTLLNSWLRGELVWLSAGMDQRAIYEGSERDTMGGYISNLYGVVESIGATLPGLLNHFGQPVVPLWHPLVVLGFAVTLGTLAALWLSGRPLPALLGIAMLFGLPYLHGQFEPIVSRSRYVAPLTPLLLAAWAVCAAEQWALWTASARRALRGRVAASSLPVGPLLVVAVVVLAAGSSLSLGRFYADAQQAGRTNDRLLDDYARLQAARRPNEIVAVDRALLRDWTLTQGRLGRVLSQWLEIDGIPFTGIDLGPDGRFSGGLQEVGGLAILARGSLGRASQAYILDEIATHAAPDAPPDRGYAIVRARRRT